MIFIAALREFIEREQLDPEFTAKDTSVNVAFVRGWDGALAKLSRFIDNAERVRDET